MGDVFLLFYQSEVGKDAEQKQSKLHVAKDSVLAQSHIPAEWLGMQIGSPQLTGGRRNE